MNTLTKGLSDLSRRIPVIILVPLLLTFAASMSACTEFKEDAVDISIPEDSGTGIAPEYDAVEGTDEGTEEPGVDALAPEDVLANMDALAGETEEGWLDDVITPEDEGGLDTLAGTPDSEWYGLDCPGPVGCPCEEPDECYSGFCVPALDGSKCTRMCSSGTECAEDELCTMYRGSSGPDAIYVCLERWPNACRPCINDVDCRVGWLDENVQPRCLKDDAGAGFCAPRVTGTEDLCPEGMVSRIVQVNARPTGFCVPEEGSCPCREEWIRSGYETECSNVNEYGTCTARRLCNQECPAVFAQPEVCDATDNDCDGLIDEDLTGSPCDITNQFGTCQGTTSCANGNEICIGQAAAKESCNGVDDDCNGLIDDGFGTTSCGLGECKKTIDNCSDGRLQICDPFKGAIREDCNGRDDDCDGRTDEDLGTHSCGKGACSKTVPVCLNGNYNGCVPGIPTAETCDAKDNDCDGAIEEGFGMITCGVCICEHSIISCVNGIKQNCDPMEGNEREVCNGLDDDCNGWTDNGIWLPDNLHEDNGICSKSEDLGDITEGEPLKSFQSFVSKPGDVDWFAFNADEHDHSCAWGTDQDYKIYATLFNPVGPDVCMPMVMELYDEKCTLVASAVDSLCSSHRIEFKWDGECGPDDSRLFKLKVWAFDKKQYSCLPYTIQLYMRKVN